MNESFKLTSGPLNSTLPEDLVGRTIPFSDPDLGKITDLKINKIKRFLGKGGFSNWVVEAEVEQLAKSSEKSRSYNMAIKKYSTTEGEATEESIRRSYNNFKILKLLNIPTWTTYRINYGEKLTLMTLGSKDNEVLLTTNDINGPKTVQFLEKKIEKIENINEFINQLKSILLTLNSKKISLNADSWGVIFTPNEYEVGTYKIRPLIADLDFLSSHIKDASESAQNFQIKAASMDNVNYIKKEDSEDEETKESIEQNLNNLALALFFIFPGNEDEKHNFANSIIERL